MQDTLPSPIPPPDELELAKARRSQMLRQLAEQKQETLAACKETIARHQEVSEHTAQSIEAARARLQQASTQLLTAPDGDPGRGA